LRPIGVGWHSVVGSYNSPEIEFRLKPSAGRWEGGSFNMPGLQALGASLSLLLELGPVALSERILDRARAVRELAARADWRVTGSKRTEDHSGIVAIEHDDVPAHEAARVLRNRGIAVAARRGKLRISPHLYNNDDDLERLSAALLSCRRDYRPSADRSST
jgi:selenocysteine lyase/cysteine desulfurase